MKLKPVKYIVTDLKDKDIDLIRKKLNKHYELKPGDDFHALAHLVYGHTDVEIEGDKVTVWIQDDYRVELNVKDFEQDSESDSRGKD